MTKPKDKEPQVVNNAPHNVSLNHCNITGGVNPQTAEAMSKMADAVIANAEAIKYIAQMSKGNSFETGIRIG